MDNKFSLANRQFSLTKLDAFKQFHIVRRMGPILIDLLPQIQVFASTKKAENLSEREQFESIEKIARPFMLGLAKLSDEDADYVFHGLLASAEVQQGQANWARIYVNGTLMFTDLELPILIQVAARAFMYNLAGFFAALPQ